MKAYIIIILLVLIGVKIVAQSNKNVEVYRVVAYNKLNPAIKSVSNTVEIKKKLQVYIPNAFTPDGDGVNDAFGVEESGIDDFSMEIFNRWGELIYQTDNIQNKWNGEINGEKCKQDAYVYVVKAKGVDDIAYTTFRGSVSLLR